MSKAPPDVWMREAGPPDAGLAAVSSGRALLSRGCPDLHRRGHFHSARVVAVASGSRRIGSHARSAVRRVVDPHDERAPTYGPRRPKRDGSQPAMPIGTA